MLEIFILIWPTNFYPPTTRQIFAVIFRQRKIWGFTDYFFFFQKITFVGWVEAKERAMISDPFPLITAGFISRSSRQAFSLKREADTATGSRTQGVPSWEQSCAAAFMAGSQEGESVPMLTQRALAWGVKSGSSSRECSMAGDAPADKRVLAMRSMETKFVMHWMRGDWVRTWESSCHAFVAHDGDGEGWVVVVGGLGSSIEKEGVRNGMNEGTQWRLAL